MKDKLPKPVETYVRAINDRNPAAFESAFATDAVVKDIGREIRGLTAISDWARNEIFAVNVTMELLHVAGRDGQTVITAKIDGTFDRTGLPDPLVMEHQITTAGDNIIALTCKLSEHQVS
ncbi:MAG TPA: nuclear transport factor 2 family protein [Verrucomicrobiota bacterium]|nr:nuclear transport factor 2 family protein [Verrucomicrobiota bacterium]